MFVTHPSLEHEERKLFAPRKFMKLAMLRFACGFKIMFQKKNNFTRRNKKMFWAGVDKINSHYKSDHNLEVIV